MKGIVLGEGRGPAHRSRRRHPTARRVPTIPPPRFFIVNGLVVVLTLFGLVMVLSASSVQALHDRRIGSPWYYFTKQALLASVGFVAFFVVSRINYHWWRRFIPAIFVASCVACMACFIPGIGRTVNGAKSWIAVGPIQGQPSELLKLALLLYCADLLARRADRMHEPAATLGPCAVMMLFACGIVLAQGDLGTAIVLGAIAIATLYLAGTPLGPLTGFSFGVTSAAALFIVMEPYRRHRFLGFLDPAGEANRFNYQANQARYAFGSGGLTGMGLGAGRAKWGYLPEAHTDFIAAIVGEELGFIGVTLMLALLAGIVLAGARVALRANDRFGMIVAGGVTAWIAIQVTINLGASAGLMPVTGLPLPFVSFGPSSLVSLMIACGLLASVARSSRP